MGSEPGLGTSTIPPDQDQRDIWEVAYIDIGIHPESTNLDIPREVSVTIRTDSSLSTGVGGAGERSLTSLEYYADRGPTSTSISTRTG